MERTSDVVNELQMWACARGHKDAMLILNQWNPLALLSLANRSSCLSSTLHSEREISLAGGQCTDDGNSPSVPSNNDCCINCDADASSSSSSSSSPPPDPCRDNDSVSPSWLGVPSQSSGDCSSLVDLPFQLPSHPTTFPPSDMPSKSSSFSPTELLCLPDTDTGCQDEDAGIDESELVHVEQSVTISFADDRPTSDVKKRMTRLKKRTSVDILPSFTQRRTSTPKISKTASVGDSVEIPAKLSGSPDTWPMTVLPPGELRVSSSDSHLSGLSKLHSSSGGPDPMISMIDHDINSPPMMFTSDSGVEIPAGFSLDTQPSTYILPCETMAVDIGMSADFRWVFKISNNIM